MKDIIFNPLLKLSNVNRYSGVYLLKPESVSDHTTQVGLMALVVGNELNRVLAKDLEEKKAAPLRSWVDLGQLALKALVHDIDEASSADIPRTVKYANAEILAEFKKLESNAVKRVSEQFNFPQLFTTWDTAKDKSLEGRIVKICDTLTVLRKTVEEINILGNKNMLRVACEVIEQIIEEKQKILVDNTLESVIIDFFIELYSSAESILKTILEDNKSQISDYYFKSQL